jgi:hypothetical protein
LKTIFCIIPNHRQADFHFGTTNAPFALHKHKGLVTLETSPIGETSQLFLSDQSNAKASTTHVPGFQNLELNFLTLRFL